MAIAQLTGVITVRFNRAGFDQKTGRPLYERQLIRFHEFKPGDVINVPSEQGDASEVLSYIASKLGVSESQLEIAEWRSYWQIRQAVGETI